MKQLLRFRTYSTTALFVFIVAVVTVAQFSWAADEEPVESSDAAEIKIGFMKLDSAIQQLQQSVESRQLEWARIAAEAAEKRNSQLAAAKQELIEMIQKRIITKDDIGMQYEPLYRQTSGFQQQVRLFHVKSVAEAELIFYKANRTSMIWLYEDLTEDDFHVGSGLLPGWHRFSTHLSVALGLVSADLFDDVDAEE